MSYRAGIIGLGFAGMESPDSHYRAYQDCKDTDLVGLCDMDTQKTTIGCPEYRWQMYLQMAKYGRLDIVSVCTPVETHCQIVCDIAPYVKAINCEKPISRTLEEADRMIETCHKHNVILQVNHQREFHNPLFRWSRGIENNGTHFFSLMKHLCGDIEEVGYSYIKFKSGLVIDIEYVSSMEYPPIFELVISRPDIRPILKGVEHLVQCLKEGKESNALEGREALKWTLEFKELWDANNR